MKTCSKCGIVKPEEAFSWKRQATGLRNAMCKLCHKTYVAEHYRANPEPYKQRARISNPILRASNRQYLLDYLRVHPCIDCGEEDIDVLEFDHIVPVGQQAKRIFQLTHSRTQMLAELAKCEVRCANCHTRRTRRQFGWGRNAD